MSERVAGKILAAQARTRGDSPFVWFGSAWHSFAEMDRRANCVANAFVAQGIGKGSRVAVLLRNRLEYLDLWFGLSRIGALQMPINCEYRAAQILQTLQRAPVDVVVVESGLLTELCVALEEMDRLPMILVMGSMPVDRPASLAKAYDYVAVLAGALDGELAADFAVSGADAGVIMNTSGTTGPSKGVVLSHAQQYILGRNISSDLELNADAVYYNFFPLFHNTAQAMITLPVLLCGARMVLTERFSASRFWTEAQAHRCTAFYYIGEILRILLRTDAPPEAGATSLRVAWGIGASAGDFAEFQSRFGIRLHTGYGSTEANVPCFLPRTGALPGSAGRVKEGFEIRIANESGEPVTAGTRGEILVRSSEPCALMLGYDADPVATVAAWRDLWFHSGDTGYVDSEGLLFFTGRTKDVIRVRGENVSAFEVEESIGALDGVLEVAAIGVPSELGGEEVKVILVPRADARLTPESVVEWARSRLPRFAVPRYVEFVTSLPKTPTNKVQKHVLRLQPFNAQTWDGDRRAGARNFCSQEAQESKCSV
ncbi:MAG: AMP-binding protein [Gammaproteobacteria bacterium]